MTIRRQPEDFIVDEQLTPAAQALVQTQPSSNHPFALYQLSKKSTNTPQAVAELGKQLRVKPGDVAFVGLKDKHAVTSQFVSVRLKNAPQQVQQYQWQAQRVGWLGSPLVADMVAGNRFVILVRDLSVPQAEVMQTLAAKLSLPHHDRPSHDHRPSLMVVNYFGDQRFGSARHREGFAAPLLLQGDYLGALKLLIATPSRKDKQTVKVFRRTLAEHWGDFAKVLPRLPRCQDRAAIEVLAKNPAHGMQAFAALPYFTQQMCVYSYQSYLWNRMARVWLERTCRGSMYEVDDAFGAMLFVPTAAIPPAMIDADLPVMGRGTELVEPWKVVAEKVLHEEGIASLRDLRLPGLRRPFFGESPRQLFMRVRDFEPGDIENDPLTKGRKMRRVSFALPRGGYATVVLRALGQ